MLTELAKFPSIEGPTDQLFSSSSAPTLLYCLVNTVSLSIDFQNQIAVIDSHISGRTDDRHWRYPPSNISFLFSLRIHKSHSMPVHYSTAQQSARTSRTPMFWLKTPFVLEFFHPRLPQKAQNRSHLFANWELSTAGECRWEKRNQNNFMIERHKPSSSTDQLSSENRRKRAGDEALIQQGRWVKGSTFDKRLLVIPIISCS